MSEFRVLHDMHIIYIYTHIYIYIERDKICHTVI